jgi:hypothetical protein
MWSGSKKERLEKALKAIRRSKESGKVQTEMAEWYNKDLRKLSVNGGYKDERCLLLKKSSI